MPLSKALPMVFASLFSLYACASDLPGGQTGSEIKCELDVDCQDALGDGYRCGAEGICEQVDDVLWQCTPPSDYDPSALDAASALVIEPDAKNCGCASFDVEGYTDAAGRNAIDCLADSWTNGQLARVRVFTRSDEGHPAGVDYSFYYGGAGNLYRMWDWTHDPFGPAKYVERATCLSLDFPSNLVGETMPHAFDCDIAPLVPIGLECDPLTSGCEDGGTCELESPDLYRCVLP